MPRDSHNGWTEQWEQVSTNRELCGWTTPTLDLRLGDDAPWWRSALVPVFERRHYWQVLRECGRLAPMRDSGRRSFTDSQEAPLVANVHVHPDATLAEQSRQWQERARQRLTVAILHQVIRLWI